MVMLEDIVKVIVDVVDFFGDLLTIIASGVAVYLFWTQREKISAAFNVLINFSQRLTLTELNQKIDKLKDHKVPDIEVIHLLNEIAGQIKGNKHLSAQLADILILIEKYSTTKQKLTEAKKLRLVAELREKMRDLDLTNYHNSVK